jgi:hypothetical protein
MDVADGRYELVKETNMVDYVESLYNGAKDAGASVEAIGLLFSLSHGDSELMIRLSITEKQGYRAVPGITGEG